MYFVILLKSKNPIINLIIMTDDHCRVRLSEQPDVVGSDYINASYIKVTIVSPFCFYTVASL